MRTGRLAVAGVVLLALGSVVSDSLGEPVRHGGYALSASAGEVAAVREAGEPIDDVAKTRRKLTVTAGGVLVIVLVGTFFIMAVLVRAGRRMR